MSWLKSGPQVCLISFLLLFTTSDESRLKNSRNLGPLFSPNLHVLCTSLLSYPAPSLALLRKPQTRETAAEGKSRATRRTASVVLVLCPPPATAASTQPHRGQTERALFLFRVHPYINDVTHFLRGGGGCPKCCNSTDRLRE